MCAVPHLPKSQSNPHRGRSEMMMCQETALCCCFIKQLSFIVGVGGRVPLMLYQRGGAGGVNMCNSWVVTETSKKRNEDTSEKNNYLPC